MSQPLQTPAFLVLIALLLLAAGGIHGGTVSHRYYPQQQQSADAAAAAASGNVYHRGQLDPSRSIVSTSVEQQPGQKSGSPPALSSMPGAAGGLPPKLRPGLSAWGLIALIVFVILCGMACYYGILCYPLFCPSDNNEVYNKMRETSSSTSSGTPLGNYNDNEKLGNYENEKLGNYSSRSTTPSKSHE